MDDNIVLFDNIKIIGNDLSDVNTSLNNILNNTSNETVSKIQNTNVGVNEKYKKKAVQASGLCPLDNAFEDGINIFNEMRDFKLKNNYENSDETKKMSLSESYFNNIKDKYIFFFTTFPLIVKFMFNLMLFHQIGFRDFLTFYFNTNPNDRHSDMSNNIKLNCKYIYYVYLQILTEHNDINGKKKDKMETIVNKALKLESNIFNMTIKEYDHIISTLKKNEEDVKANKRERLIEFVKKNY